MVKVIDWIIVVNGITMFINLISLINGNVGPLNVVALLFCSLALGAETIVARMKLRDIEKIVIKVKEKRGMSWDESF